MSINYINLIQAAIMAVTLQGCLLLWARDAYKGVCLFMLLVTTAALLNLFENIGVTTNTTLITPVFQLLWGPALYLACNALTNRQFSAVHWLHFLPAVIALGFTEYVQLIIALGSLSRIGYSFLTAKALFDYKARLDIERSDADEYSFTWLIWVVGITTTFNLVDLIRLNIQSYIPAELNMIGQATNNLVWLVVVMYMIYKFNSQKVPPATSGEVNGLSDNQLEDASQYQSIFEAVDKLVLSEALFRQERLTLSQLSELLGLQSRDVSRAINLVGKKNFNEYINGLRIDYVCKLLSNTSHESVIELALQSGFSSKASFNRIFKQLVGKTPSQYQNQ